MATLPLLPQGGSAPAQTAGDLLARLYPLLNAESAGDLAYWTEAELVAWLNEALKRLARRAGLFIERDTSIAVVAGTSDYLLPARHLSTLHASLGGASVRAANVREIEGLSATWLADVGTPAYYLHDFGAGVERVRLYRKPAAPGTLALIEHEYPAELTAASTVPLPAPVADAAFFAVLAEARRRESDGAMLEVADVCDGLVSLYGQLFEDYWGDAA